MSDLNTTPPEASANHYPRYEPVRFTGSGSEFFGIWIVNVLLTIITLGIYSAWAKVRTTQYFYANTHINNSSFEYLANPVSILIGRIIAAVFFVAMIISERQFELTQNVNWQIAYYSIVGFIWLVIPWLITKSLAFRARNSAYRGVRFQFEKKYLIAYWVFLVLPVILLFATAIVFTLATGGKQPPELLAGQPPQVILNAVLGIVFLFAFIMIPVLTHVVQKFKMNHLRYGSSQFSYNGGIGHYYGVLIIIAIVTFIFANAIAYLFFSLMGAVYSSAGTVTEAQLEAKILMIVVPIYILTLMLYAFIHTMLQAAIMNHVWNNTTLGKHRFASTVNGLRLLWILISNLVLIVLTLGIFIPWAKVRLVSYRLSQTQAIINSDLDEFVANEEQQQEAALGEGAADVFDFDISL